tara:strand:+ start:52 stop:225 length:174 start_codon:yes stop_codon:yes gene_type:complete
MFLVAVVVLVVKVFLEVLVEQLIQDPQQQTGELLELVVLDIYFPKYSDLLPIRCLKV